jgi:lysophospholipase L1-like esterase
MKEKADMRKHAISVPLFLLFFCLVTGCRLVKADPKVAFLGDSITQGWNYPRANFGIHGNTTAQMLERFSTSIAGKHYKQVVILGGTNDVLLGIDPDVTIRNLEAIANKAIESGAEPILCEIPPIFHAVAQIDRNNYSEKVRTLNRRIAELAAARKWSLVDYYDPILGHPDYSSDGVHMKRRGYAVMEITYLREAPAAP